MEALFRLLPGPQPIWVRYGVTALMVLFAFALRLGIEDRAGDYGFLLYILPITVSALLYDRGTGVFATALSVALVACGLNWDGDTKVHVAALAMFTFVSLCLVIIAEGLHKALAVANEAQRGTELLLQEMSHRVKNKFAMISSIISLEARRGSDEVQAALDDIARRVQVIAAIHDSLQVSRRDGLISMGDYVTRLCGSLQAALCGARGIVLQASSVDTRLAPEKALAVGLIINELVTNAFKYAFENEGVGRVEVALTDDGDGYGLFVVDNGKGCDEPGGGLGTKLVSTFAGQLGGSAKWERVPDGGCQVAVKFPR